MHPPDELMVESFLPSMRALVSRRLHEQGFSQGRIASLLGITQASVSLYLSGKAFKPLDLVSDLGISREEADRYSRLLAEDLKKNPANAVGTLYSIWTNLLGRGLICSAHRRRYPFLASCDICMKTYGSQRSEHFEGIDEVSQATLLLESSHTFAKVMPQLSVNIAYAHAHAVSPEDVVAIPGRVVKVRDEPRVFTKPEYGASAHLARVLLQVRTRTDYFRAAINIKYDDEVERILKRLRLKTLTIGGAYPRGADDPIVEALRQKMKDTDQRFDALIDVGGLGFEPCLYLFGKDPVEVAKLAIKVSSLYTSHS